MIPSLLEIKNQFTLALESLYPSREAKHLTRMLLQEMLPLSPIEQLTQPDYTPDAQAWEQVQNGLNQLLRGLPIQYVLGRTVFYGLSFSVNPHTLIPRPETEELVRHLLTTLDTEPSFSDQEAPLRLLDIGTGSGCIAISLAKHRPKDLVFAVDLSSEALAMARMNAKEHQVKIQFDRTDILAWETQFPKHATQDGSQLFDLIVSNPPYIPQSEAASMHQNVRDHEPHGALFVPDDDPLIFYRSICNFAKIYLRPGGQLWFELHDALTSDYRILFEKNTPFLLQMHADIHGKVRMAQLIRGLT